MYLPLKFRKCTKWNPFDMRVGPTLPEPHGEFMAAAYETSPWLGQMAVSYVLTHYYNGPALPPPTRPLPPRYKEALRYLSMGTKPEEIAHLTGHTLQYEKNRRRDLYSWLGVRLSPMTAVRMGIEHVPDVIDIPTTRPLYGRLHPYDMVAADMLSRNITLLRMGAITGYKAGERKPFHRLRMAFNVEKSREGRLPVLLHHAGILQKGVMYMLDEYPDIIRRFDAELGRNQPFLFPQPE